MSETTIGGYEILGKLGDSKRFRAFRASRRAAEGERRGTLYLMTDEVRHPDLFIETVDTIRAAWPFSIESNRDYVLPKAQLWTGRPWFFLPEVLPVATAARLAGREAFASLRAQLRWLEQFHPPGGEPHFAHGDVRKERIALFDAEHPLLIAPGWVAASELARGKSLSHVRGDDAWHLGKLWIQETDHSFVPDGMESEPDELARRLPRARLPQRGQEAAPAPAREAARVNGNGAREAAVPRERAATPPPGRVAAVKRDGSGITAAPAARAARPVRETPPPREAAPVREAPALRDTGSREGLPREAAFGAPPAAPARPPAPGATPPPGRVAAVKREGSGITAPAAGRPNYVTPPPSPAAPMRTPAPPLAAVPPIASAPPPREATGAARQRPPAPPQSAMASPPYDAPASPPEYLRSVPPAPVDLGPPPPEPLREPVRSYHESTRAPTELALPAQPVAQPSRPPASLAPSPPQPAAAPKKRGMQIAVILVLLVLVAVFVAALTMLKR